MRRTDHRGTRTAPEPCAAAPEPRAAAPEPRGRCAECGRRPATTTARDSSGIVAGVCSRCAQGDDFERAFNF